ncbi:hypothetical protein BDA99DRAFT_92887 [Phascolomyces articulosus]|uniref:GATA-type domain-containing protein n=1 Tax=Phascolomyces articulosus TaxID=60185 RepID=A0AAD5K7R1_9FUNG|nr:hypothetical protein BDA99DRAFT_92887 [Phascolomyces articulosus]
MGGHRVEIHYLGLSYLQSGPHCVSSAAFYEITETTDTVSSEEMEQSPSLLLSSSPSPILSTTGITFDCGNMINANNNNNSNMLPPKKRRRHKVIRNDVIFCIDPPPASDMHTPSSHLDYYLFPHDAVAGPVNDVPPFEILFSFHVLDTHIKERRPTKLEEFAAVCSSANRMYPRRRSTDPGSIGNNNLSSAGGGILSSATSSGNYNLMATIPTMPVDDPRSKVVNMRISGVSRRLFVAIKQTVSEFETVCEKMVQLMTYHTQQMAGQKGSPTAPRPLLSPPPIIPSAHSEWEELLNSRDPHRHHPHHPQEQRNYYQKFIDACSSDDASFDKDDMLVDPMPKNSYSNGTNTKNNHSSRHPTSPRSAPTSSNNNNHSSSNKSAKNNTTNSSNSSNSNNNNGNTTSKGRNNSNGGAVKKCLYCGSKSTPMWRRGPQGAGTLCNACGVKWKHGKILTGSSSSDMNPPSTPSTATKERRGSSNKNEKKRKKSSSSGNGNTGGRATAEHHHQRTSGRSASATPVMDTTPPFKSPSSSSSRGGHNCSDDDEMENNINAARNLSIRESEDEYQHYQQRLSSSVPSNNHRMDTFAVPWLPRDNSNYTSFVPSEQQRYTMMMAATEAQSISSSSHSISGSFSPIESSSPGSSPRLSSTASSVTSIQHHQQHYQYQHTRRHTMDVTMTDKMGYNNETSFAMSSGVDAVEAAALLTLLKRS